MGFTVVVPTFGDQGWIDLAYERAIPSAAPQAPVIHVHGDTLAASRNAGLARAETEWVVFCDADDELAPGYIEAMGTAIADMRYPAVSTVVRGRAHPPAFDQPCDLREGNYLSIGTAVRRELATAVGGFREWPIFEDWDLWQRCWNAGARAEPVPGAVYLAHKAKPSRSRSHRARRELHKTFDAIRRANHPELFVT